MKKQFLHCLLLLCSFSIHSQAFDTTRIDSLFNSLEKENKVMGTISIFQNGEEVFEKSIGYKNFIDKSKANRSTKYRIASVSKTYTAAIILKLAELGKLNLSDYLSKYFPEVPNANVITIEHLLYHRSGLYNLTDEKGFQKWISEPRSRSEMLNKIVKNGTIFQPDEKESYSNTNFILLAYITEVVDKKSFSEIVHDRIVQPLHLENTSFGNEINLKNNEAFSYYWEDSKWNPITLETNLIGTMGAGGIVSTASEVNAFYSNLFNGNIISNEWLSKMTSSKDGMGMGLHINDYKNFKLYAHVGGMDGFRSMAAIIPKKNVSIAMTLNASTIPVTEIMILALEYYFSKDSSMQSKSPISLTSEDLDKYLGVYSGKTFPAKVTFTKKKNVLFAQATGQPIFELLAKEKNVFLYDVMGITFHFNIQDKTLQLSYGGQEHLLTKE